jgi:hypothetical protein
MKHGRPQILLWVKTGGSDMSENRHTSMTIASMLVGVLLIASVSSLAQKRGDSSVGGTATSRRDTLLIREADIQRRELDLRLLKEPGKTKNASASAEDRKVIVREIFEDFERIQVVNREMMVAGSSLNAAAYKRISTLAEEMTKRGKRLKSNLGIPDLAEEKKEPDEVPSMDAAQVKASLQTLNISVRSFVTSPLFQDPRVTDVRQLQNLRRDISSVIELSRMIKKAVGKLHD